jgi:hypothetical protein
MIEIKHRYTEAVLHRSEHLTLREAILEALRGGADLGGANLRSANLYGADLGGANLGGANLGGADLRSADLRSADLRSANLRSANLYGANLYGADLGGADLGGANLRSADLRSADLRSADLRSANLRSANLRSADLRSANLRSANLYGADLGGADLYGANLYGANLGGTKGVEEYFAKFREDIHKILELAPGEVPGLLTALRTGKVDGSTYGDGDCACLVGTLDRNGLKGLPRDSSRPAEMWFARINRGDTPETNPAAAQAYFWAASWLEDYRARVPSVVDLATEIKPKKSLRVEA